MKMLCERSISTHFDPQPRHISTLQPWLIRCPRIILSPVFRWLCHAKNCPAARHLPECKRLDFASKNLAFSCGVFFYLHQVVVPFSSICLVTSILLSASHSLRYLIYLVSLMFLRQIKCYDKIRKTIKQ